MHSIVLLTAMTATSGLFGGNRHHKATRAYAPATTCQSGRCAAPTAYAPAPVYAPAPRVAAAPLIYRSNYSAAAAPACATGNCPRR